MPLAYAGIWKRAGAFSVDFVILVACVTATELLFAESTPVSKILSTLPAALYFVVTEASPWQASLGKSLFGLRVMEANGRRVTLIRSAVRTACKLAPWLAIVSGNPTLVMLAVLPYVAGLAGILLNRRHRAWYDLVSGTAVIAPPAP
jgi:uncharacterized RDD family membrane protein YckC